MADIVWKTVSLPRAFVGEAYEAGFAHNGSATAITASAVVTGALPPGVALSADFVRLTGTPTKAGTYTFTISLTDTAGAVTSGSLSILVEADLPSDEMRAGAQTVAGALARLWR